MINDLAGIYLADSRRTLVVARLGKRLRELGLTSFNAYRLRLEAGTDPAERQKFIDLLTTNETYFFREPPHFDLLRERIAPDLLQRRQPVRVWSAACSTGEEAYSIAMVLSDEFGNSLDWEVFGTDINHAVIDTARRGHFRMDRLDMMPAGCLRNYCLKGTGQHEGTLLIERSIRKHTLFEPMNLAAPIPDVGLFDVIFLRNMLIYFRPEKKREIVQRVARHLREDGWLIIGHSESLRGMDDALSVVTPSVYRWT